MNNGTDIFKNAASPKSFIFDLRMSYMIFKMKSYENILS